MCMYRAQFHISLARLGKTPLSSEERQFLAPDQYYGGNNLPNFNVSNPIFLYDMHQMKDDRYWDELAQYLELPEIKHDRYHGSHGVDKSWGKNHQIDICDAQYDDFRKAMMPISYELYVWLDRFFQPVAVDPNRPDVVVPQPEQFFGLIQRYSQDPCGRLERTDDGSYVLKQNVSTFLSSPEKKDSVAATLNA